MCKVLSKMMRTIQKEMNRGMRFFLYLKILALGGNRRINSFNGVEQEERFA